MGTEGSQTGSDPRNGVPAWEQGDTPPVPLHPMLCSLGPSLTDALRVRGWGGTPAWRGGLLTRRVSTQVGKSRRICEPRRSLWVCFEATPSGIFCRVPRSRPYVTRPCVTQWCPTRRSLSHWDTGRQVSRAFILSQWGGCRGSKWSEGSRPLHVPHEAVGGIENLLIRAQPIELAHHGSHPARCVEHRLTHLWRQKNMGGGAATPSGPHYLLGPH